MLEARALLSEDYADRGDAPFPLLPSSQDANTSLDAGLQCPTATGAITLRVPGNAFVR